MINISIESIIVELRILDPLLLWLLLISLMEDVHDLDCHHNAFLTKAIIHYNDSNIVLELMDC